MTKKYVVYADGVWIGDLTLKQAKGHAQKNKLKPVAVKSNGYSCDWEVETTFEQIKSERERIEAQGGVQGLFGLRMPQFRITLKEEVSQQSTFLTFS